MTSSQDTKSLDETETFTLDESMMRLCCLYCACLITNTSLTYPERMALNYAELFTLFVKSGARRYDELNGVPNGS